MDRKGEHYLTIHEVATKIGWSTRTIRRKVKARSFPVPFLFGKGWCWLQSDVDKWMYRTAAINEIDPETIPDDEKKERPSADNRGHSGTSLPGDDLPPSGKRKGG